ncbi:MAG: LytR/AlgR family response regulator transcription factor [Bryobacteraceae bacterium]
MITIGTVVVDDEPLARANIVSLLLTDPEIHVLGECSSGADAAKVVRELRPSLLFLDVQMPGCDGFGVLEALGADVPPAVVFVTAYDQYALKAFEAEALDYLLKPYDNARFFRVLSRAKALLARRPGEHRRIERIMVRSAGRISFLRAPRRSIGLKRRITIRACTSEREHTSCAAAWRNSNAIWRRNVFAAFIARPS